MKTVHALAFGAVLIAEFWLFHVMTARHHAWIYPRWFDQVQYLGEAYRGYEQMLDRGFTTGVKETLTNLSPQGILHGFWALLVFCVAGPSRNAALDVNILAFLVLQTVTFLVVRRLAGSTVPAWISSALLLALQSPWSGGSGSAVDFRLDWMAACAYGVTLGIAIAGRGFRSTRWALLLGVAVGLTLLTRYLTAVYFALIFALFLAGLLTRPDRWRRIGRLMLSGMVATLIAGPFFWHSRHVIYNYYWIGHVIGPERALRDWHLDAAGSVKWILSELFLAQVGLAAVAICVGGAVALWVLGLIRWTRAERNPVPRLCLGPAWAMTLVFLAVPAFVLCVHSLKASQPVSILAPAVIWIGVLSCAHLARRVRPVAAAVVAGLVVLAGAMVFVAAESRTPYPAETAWEARKLNALADYVYDRAEECGLVNPRFAMTLLADGISGPALQVLGYERHHRWLGIEQSLSTGLIETTRDAVMQQLAQSDFVWLVTRADAGQWPFNHQMMAMLPETRPWCEANLRRVGEVEVTGIAISVYERTGLQRIAEGEGVDLAKLIDAATKAPASPEADPPGPPVFPRPLNALWSTRTECFYRLRAAYSPVRYRAEGLPDGLYLDPRNGVIRGRFPRAGMFPVTVSARNSAGSTTAVLTFQVENKLTFAVVQSPAACKPGQPVAINFDAFDGAGRLDFIDITDLTLANPLGRLVAGEQERQSWQGRYQVTFLTPGRHTVLFRIVSFDPTGKTSYSFIDKSCDFDVTP